MKKIDIPIERTFATQAIDLHEAINDLTSGKKTIIKFPDIDFSVGQELDQARANGGMIIWSTICLENKLETIITEYMFPNSGHIAEQRGRYFFSNRIIKSDHFTYAAKKNLVVEIVNENSLLEGRDKDGLTKNLKKLMDYRNMFAHGDIIHEAKNGCVLQYWSGDSQREVLDENFWNNLEDCFKSTYSLVNQIINKIKSNQLLDLNEDQQ